MTWDITLRCHKDSNGVRYVDVGPIVKYVPAVCAMPVKPAHVIDWQKHEAGIATMDALIAERRASAVLATGKPFAAIMPQEQDNNNPADSGQQHT